MMHLQRVCEQFLNHCNSAISLSEHTQRAYSGDLKNAQIFFGRNTELGNIQKDYLRRYIGNMRNELSLKESTIKRRIACLKLLFKWARQEHILKKNPFDTLNERIRLPKRLPRAIDSADANKLRIPVKLDSDSTPSWTRIPEQAGRSERSDAGFSGFTLLMS